MSKPCYGKFGKYTLLKSINTGGMAEILLAVHMGVEGFEKLTAIKRILPHLSQNQEFISMFIGEAKLAAQLTHQNIIHIYDFGRIEDSYYIAMEYVRGKNLRELLQQCRCKGVETGLPLVLDIVAAICRGLDYAHRKCGLNNEPLNIVHRDINPHNILISYEGEVELVDFGIAKAAMHTQETKVGVLKGKVSYMSPEQISGQPLNNRSDIFSLGIVLYELATGQRLFKGSSEIDAMLKVKQAQIPAPRDINPNISPKLAQVILKALAKDPAERYQRAAEFHADIQAVQDSFGSKERVRISVFMERLFREIMLQENNELAELLNTIKELDVSPSHSAPDPQQQLQATLKDVEVTTVIVKPSSRGKPYWIAALLSLVVLGLILIVGYPGVGQLPLNPLTTKIKAKFVALQQAKTLPATPAQDIDSQPAALPEALPEPAPLPAEPPQPEVIKLSGNIAQANIVDLEKQKELSVKLNSLPASLSISSEPAGAMVILNRVFKGKTTPTVLEELSPQQTHQIGLRLPGYYRWDTKIVLKPGKRMDLGRIVLKPKSNSIVASASQPGTIKLYTNIAQADIYVNGKKRDLLSSTSKPLLIKPLEPDKVHRLKIVRHGYTLWKGSFSIDSGEQKELTANLDPLPASLSISSEPPGAMVILDRVFKGKVTPTVLDGLSPQQTHQIELRMPGYHKWKKKIVIDSNKHLDIGHIVLKPITTSFILDSSPAAML